MTESALPRWDLTGIFPSPTSGEYLAAVATVRTGIEQMSQLFDEFGIGLDSGAHPQTEPGRIISTWNDTSDLADLLDNYLYCWTSTDSNDDAAASAYGELDMITSPLRALRSRLTTWLGTIDPDASNDPLLSDHRYQVKQAAIGARHVMAPELEELAGALQATGGQAWVRSRDESDAGLTTTITIDGETRTTSLTELDSLLSSPDREKRRTAAEAMDVAREKAAPQFAASLNAIKGEALTLSKRRKWDSPLDWSLFISAIDREILDAMFAAAESVHGDLHRYLLTKARLLGIEQMAHFDLSAPISTDQKEVTWGEAENTVRTVLSPFSERLAAVVDAALTQRWVDAEPREGKVGGGYCAGLQPYGSRIMMNFVPSFDTTQTLAHELGHAHHNACLGERSALQKETPMTLAETASMFCQRMVEDQVLAEASPEEKLIALDQILSNNVGTLLDLHARFHFEQEVFARRLNRTLSVDELTEIMKENQQIAYGPGLAADAVHKWQWVQKPHYYDTDFHYYNYPYQFGLLFALGLLKVYRDQPEGFAERYETLLSRTAMATAYDLAREFGIDVRDRAFWDGSVAVIRGDVAQFEQVAAQSIR
ncbi:MAG TPA: M3 family metallopeptidase [Thermomicrobiales bacterium]|nr:M3 family metallopeptidase [Thermomicrobiales bacterium]